jgi:hypothetical protein
MTIEDISVVRHYTDEQDKAIYGDAFILDLITTHDGNLYRVASEIWGMKAARWAKLVNVSESGSQRALGERVKNAQSMAAYYLALSTGATGGDGVSTAGASSGTRRIVRPTS